jgi:hypothetical protein
MNLSSEKIRDLLPLYVNKNLPWHQRKVVEFGIYKNPELQEELYLLRELQKTYKEMKEEDPDPSPELFSRVMKETEQYPRQEDRSSVLRIGDTIRKVLRNPLLGWGAAAVQAAAILMFVCYPGISQKVYDTYSSPPPSATAEVRYNIMFRNAATEEEIRSLLLPSGLQIVAGPNEEGLYVLEFRAKEQKKPQIGNLRESDIVLLFKKQQ